MRITAVSAVLELTSSQTKTENLVVLSGYEQQLTDKPAGETIGEHFDIVDWDSITDERLDYSAVEIMAGYNKKVWNRLLTFCEAIVERRKLRSLMPGRAPITKSWMKRTSG